MISQFRDLSHELGFVNAIYWIVNRLCDRARIPFRILRYYFIAQPVAPEPMLPSRRGRAIEIRLLRPEDGALKSLPLDDAVLRYRFDQNAVCFGAFQDGAIVGCLWICLATYNEDEVRCRYILSPEKTAWDFDVYVAPRARGGFAFLKLWDAANAYLRERDVGWSLSRISAFNPVSLRSHDNFGARRLASALFLQAGSLQLLLSPLKPFIHLSLKPHQVPRLSLSVTTMGSSK